MSRGDLFQGRRELRERQALAREFSREQCYRALQDEAMPLELVATISARLRELRIADRVLELEELAAQKRLAAS